MSNSIKEIREELERTLDTNGALELALLPSGPASSVLDDFKSLQIGINPLWKKLEDRARRGAGTPVDLGLSVLWSSRNVGAASGELPGKYVGWADRTGEKTSTDAKDYPSASPLHRISGTSYDIARHLWAESWRLPTRDEVRELIEKCQWYWTVINNVPGVQIVGSTGNSIFLPAAGNRYGTEYEEAYYAGRYWTGDIFPNEKTRAYCLEFDQQGPVIASMARHIGMCIRPVLNK